MNLSPSIGCALAVALTLLGCGSNVTVETSGTGGAGATTATGGGGAGGSVSAAGGASTGGASTGGASTGGASTGGTGGTTITCETQGGVCPTCLSTGCPEVFCACQEEPHCFGYLECLGTCIEGPPDCAQSCAAVHEPGITAAILVADCSATTCAGDCMFGEPLNDCQKCTYGACPDEMNACIADAECLAVIACFKECPEGDTPCYQACASAHPDGFAVFKPARDCQKAACQELCP